MTSLPRPALLGIVGVVLLAGVFMLSHRSSSDQSTPAPPVAPSSAPATPGASAKVTPPATSGAPATTPNSVPEPNAAAKEPRPSQSRTLPAPVSRALKSHKVLVLLFWSPRGVDDRAVKDAVAGVSNHGGKVAVFTDRLRRLARYTKITAGANVTQTPTLVVTNSKGEARVATGYLDPTTVEQYVVDALHGAP